MRQLRLMVESHQCSCGNSWTHSYLRYLHGGTPIPVDAIALKTVALSRPQYTRNHLKCFNCVDHSLPDWPDDPAAPAPKTPNLLD